MDSNKRPNEGGNPIFTPQEPKDTGKPSAKSIPSNQTTHGSLTSGSGPASASNSNHGASSGNSQCESPTVQKWLEETLRDEPWRPGSRRA